MIKKKQVGLTLLSGVLVLAAGCAETGSVDVSGSVDGSNKDLMSGGALSLALGDGTLSITRATLAVSEVELEGGTEDDEIEAEFGAATIDLSLDGSPTPVLTQEVDIGSYHTIGVELRSGGGAIVVEGTYNDAPFTFTSALSPEVEFPISPEATVTAGSETQVGLTFDVAAWFVKGDTLLDPSDAENQRAIEKNIIDSMAARGEIEFEDDDDDDD